MTEEKAIEKGKKFIHSAFQINTDDTIISVEYIPGDNDYVENAYGVDFGTSQGEHYMITMNAATENLQDITFYENEEMHIDREKRNELLRRINGIENEINSIDSRINDLLFNNIYSQLLRIKRGDRK